MTTETHNGEADANYWQTMHAVLLAAFERRTAALRQVQTVMGPKVPSCCQGCGWEWAEALRIVKAELEGEDDG